MKMNVPRPLVMIALFAWAAVALGAGAPAPEETLPSGEEVARRAIEASGGKEVLDKIHNRVVQGKMEIKGMGVKGEVVAYQARPNKTYTKVDIEGIGTVEKGTLDDVAWETHTLTGPRIAEGEEKALLLFLAHFDETTFLDLLRKIECVGVEEVRGEPCYKVVATPKDKDVSPLTAYYSKATGLTMKLDITYPHQMGTIQAESLTDDYRKVDGMMLPHRTVEKTLTIETHVTITGYRHNVDLPDDRFDLSEAIKALVERAKQEESEKTDSKEPAPAGS